MPDVSTLTLNNGVTLPALGLGVFQTPPDETRDAVTAALEAGYRHIDTAAAYGNERQVGEAVAASGLDRSEVFVETKIWISDYGYDQTLHGFEKSARKLGVDQIDLLILHQALPSEFESTLEAYRALETLLADGKVRAIGVSNFMVDHLTTLLDRASVVPAVNQIEVHPYFQQREVQALGAEHGILTQAWSPIGGITFYRDGQHSSTLQDPVIGEHRRGARQDPGAGDAALAPAAGPFGDPEVDQAGPDRGEPRRLRLRPDRRRSSPRSTPSTPVSAAAPSPRRSPWRRSDDPSPRTEPASSSHDHAMRPLRPSRRTLLRAGLLLGAGGWAAALAGCTASDSPPPPGSDAHRLTSTRPRQEGRTTSRPDLAGLLLPPRGELLLRRAARPGGRQHRGAWPA